jgi:hypothetical protein
MLVASAFLTLQQCRNPMISRRSSAGFVSGQTVAAKADFPLGKELASWAERIRRVQLYAASASTLKNYTQVRPDSQADAKSRFSFYSAKAALSTDE